MTSACTLIYVAFTFWKILFIFCGVPCLSFLKSKEVNTQRHTHTDTQKHGILALTGFRTNLAKDTNQVPVDIPECHAAVICCRQDEVALVAPAHLQTVDHVYVSLELTLQTCQRDTSCCSVESQWGNSSYLLIQARWVKLKVKCLNNQATRAVFCAVLP